MKIGFDASNLLVSQKTGVENYTTAMILALAEALPQQVDTRLFLYFNAGSRFADLRLLDGFLPRLRHIPLRIHRLPRGFRAFLILMAWLDRLDLLHLPSPAPLRFCPCPIVMTAHDVAWAHLPQDGFDIEGAVAHALESPAVPYAAAWLAVSEATRQDMIRHYQVPMEKIWVIHHGVREQYRQVAGAGEAVRRKYGLERYILSVAALQYRKNHVRLLQAFSILRSRYAISHQLVIVGRQGLGYERVYAEYERLGLGDSVVFMGYVPDAEMPLLYSAASLLVYPSLLEGFGLPILEAMACGTVVAASNTSSIPEIGGDAIFYFDPVDVEQMAEVMLEALTDVSARDVMRQKGLVRARLFSWENAAWQTLQAYRQVIENAKGNALADKR